ncbi:hypothetical protein EGT29_26480 [Pigmentiphaga sp. H8]|uniref:NAD(P)/FAD-dependent oxidoreductase n=1 Tax=Pigmentiphaga sp. H8 TaxID=2488560 RepID=UPI000F5AA148|nr:FAD-dependent oxidoreductase [Pigmentiphaga sp. H8]AZG11154.1 hypothetical protein EGT29_26480 [Pigmentiphaga sp. H8]
MKDIPGQARAGAEPVRILVIGAGHAGAVAAFAARRADRTAEIELVGEEAHLPYERPPLSKEALSGSAAIAPKFAAAAYAEARIAVATGVRATVIDRARKTVQATDGQVRPYDRLVLASGSRVRRWPGGEALGRRLCYLRTVEDAAALRGRLRPGMRVAVIGAGFIGLEVAASARLVGAEVAVFDRAPTVLARVLPPAAAAVVEARHRAQGVALHLGAAIADLGPDGDGIVVATDRGTVQADFAVVGIGVVPNTELAAEAGLEVDDGLVVDECGHSSDPHIFGAGEVTRHPVGRTGVRQRIESWQVAESQAAAAGASAAGCPAVYDAVPWFWSDQYGMNIQSAGDLRGPGEWIVRGEPAGSHSCYRLDEEGRILGAATFDAAKDMAAIRRLMQRETRVAAALLRDPGVPMRQLLAIP